MLTEMFNGGPATNNSTSTSYENLTGQGKLQLYVINFSD